MSVVIDAIGDRIYRDANLISNTAGTMAGWVKFVDVTTLSQAILVVDADPFANRYGLILNSTTSILRLDAESGGAAAVDLGTFVPTEGVWYYMAFTAGTGATDGFKGYVWNEAGSLLASATTDSLASSGGGYEFMNVGNNHFSTARWCNAKFAHVRIWDAALSQAELEAERASASIVRTANINTAFRGDDAACPDISGNGRNWTTAGTITLDSGDNPTLGGVPLPVFLNQFRQRRE